MRRAPVAWLVVLVLLVGIGVVVFLTVPLRLCPTCHAFAKECTKRSPAFPQKLNCPDCRDRGTVSLRMAMRGCGINPDLFGLIQSRDISNPTQEYHLARLEARANRAPGEVAGAKYFRPDGRDADYRFVQAEGTWYVLMILMQPGFEVPAPSPAGIILFGTDGRVLDFIHCTCSTEEALLWPHFVDDASDGALVCVKWKPSLFFPVRADFAPKFTAIHRADGSDSIPTAARIRGEQVGKQEIFRVGVSGDRLRFVEAGR